ncbi:MAG: hypothetical protein ACOYK7_11540 [Pirellulales bacterium]
MSLPIKPRSACGFDQVSLGEVMLRLDPGEGRIRTARQFQAWEGGVNTTSPAACGNASVCAPRWSAPSSTTRSVT